MSDSTRRAYWLKTLHRWHWISSALCLIGMIIFAATGITLNHAASIESAPQVQSLVAQLPDAMLDQIQSDGGAAPRKAPLPATLRAWLKHELSVEAGSRDAEWSEDEIYLSLPRPGGDAWLAVDLASGEVEYELTTRGWVSYLNDLHKGRNTGVVWRWFIDIFAAACLVFSLTGLFLLKMHAGGRFATWPVVGLGVLIPALLALLFIH
ncbi:hypothetical protein ERD78_13075 [Allopusillimonas soli]|uniref:PepSY-associated TM helix domain-containing protein n=1 Tax=Allopusillimonas soli TaxID=659016 RepID=A0A853FCY6_9BURK|nr:PepSY-associated TM helix domain-containing protein [Allopusillimonas soli]NYT37807.1 PepSY-associated TM helix domain-containing protein [Allopusillimonas soli]TEA73716.1 hypothetical protein ERD78_13075 [Allopusillimonas soli]